MKRSIVLVLAVAMLAGLVCSCAWGDVPIDEEHFPDETFREYVKSHFDKDKDDILNDEEIIDVIRIDVSGSSNLKNNIVSLQGIEYFVYLETLDCSYNF